MLVTQVVLKDQAVLVVVCQINIHSHILVELEHNLQIIQLLDCLILRGHPIQTLHQLFLLKVQNKLVVLVILVQAHKFMV